MTKYASWKCDRCNLILKAKNKTKLARLVKVHLAYHDNSNSNNNDEDEEDTSNK